MEEESFPRYFSRQGPGAAGGERGALRHLPLLPHQSATQLWLQVEKGGRRPCSWTWIYPFLQPASTTGDLQQAPAFSSLLVACGQLEGSGIVAPQNSHPTGLGGMGRNQMACVLVDSRWAQRKERESLGTSACGSRVAAGRCFPGGGQWVEEQKGKNKASR